MPPANAEPSARLSALVGAALRARRAELGLTLTALSEQSGLSGGFISQIETGAANPTLGALSQLAAALDVSPALLLAGEADGSDADFPAAIRPAPLAPPDEVPGRVWELTAPGARSARVVLVQGTPGDHAAPIRHTGEEVCTVVAGKYRLHIEQGTTVLKTGDTAHYSASTTHRLEPVGHDARAVITIVSG